MGNSIKPEREIMQEVLGRLGEDVSESQILEKMYNISIKGSGSEIAEITDKEVAEKLLAWYRKCEDVEFTDFIGKRLQMHFYCLFDGLIEVEEDGKLCMNEGGTFYKKWYKKEDRLYSINWLTIGAIKKLMRRSVKMGSDFIMMLIESLEKDNLRIKKGKDEGKGESRKEKD